MSEKTLVVGKRGEIYTDEALRRRAGIKKHGRVRATVEDGRLVLVPLPSLEELIKTPVIKMKASEAEKLSEEAQEEAGLVG